MPLPPKQILEKCSALKIQETRQIDDDYAEIVFYAKDTASWKQTLAEVLGPAINPEDVNNEENLAFTKGHGGMNDGQTLFKKEDGDTTVIAMLWPWSDGELTTLKLILFQKKRQK